MDDAECIVRYNGIKKSAIWWMSLDDFENIFQDFNGDVAIQSDYVLYKGQQLHLIVMGRSKGQGDHDNLVGRHSQKSSSLSTSTKPRLPLSLRRWIIERQESNMLKAIFPSE